MRKAWIMAKEDAAALRELVCRVMNTEPSTQDDMKLAERLLVNDGMQEADVKLELVQ